MNNLTSKIYFIYHVNLNYTIINNIIRIFKINKK